MFPLDVVVFPGMTVPLQVYEERYKRLVQHASERTPPHFAIAPPPPDRLDEYGPDRPGTVGTLTEVMDVSDNLDGTLRVLGHGRERCRLHYRREERIAEHSGGERTLWFAEPEPWPLQRGDPNAERVAAWDALDAFQDYGKAFFAPQARRQARAAMPDDPLYQASFVCANLRLPVEDAQRLLEADSLEARFSAARDAIKDRLAERRGGSDGGSA